MMDAESIASEKSEQQRKECPKEKLFVERVTEEYKTMARSRFFLKRGYQRRMPLWLFLIAVIKSDSENICIAWTKREEYEFVVKDRELLAKTWGLLKGNIKMDYSKLTRALRYYYGKDIIEKVSAQPYTYKFIVSENTIHYLPRVTKKQEKRERPKSLPNFFSLFGSLLKSEIKEEKFEDSPRDRTQSMPAKCPIIDIRQDSMDIDIVSSSASSDTISSIDDCADFSMQDPWEPFQFRRRKTKEKEPITACFKAGDLPLLHFDDLLRLDDECSSDTSDCCSPRSCEISTDTSFWMSKMNENPDLKLSLDDAVSPGTSIGKNGNACGKSPVDIDVEMELLHQVISENEGTFSLSKDCNLYSKRE